MAKIKIKTEDGYTFVRETHEDKHVWTDGDMIFNENKNGLPIDDQGEVLSGCISIADENDSDFLSSDNLWVNENGLWGTELGGFSIDDNKNLVVRIDNGNYPVAEGNILPLIILHRKYMEMLEEFSMYDTGLDFPDVVMLPREDKISLLQEGGHFKKMSTPLDFKKYLSGFKSI